MFAPLLAISAALGLASDEPEDWGDGRDAWAESPEYETSRALCRAVRGREPPAADRPTPEQAAALAGCSSEALYYGIGMQADPERARLCAFVEAAQPEDGQPLHPFSGRAMLMTIYANGRGAARDLDVAIHLACATASAPAEVHGRVMHLAERRASGAGEADFHYCDNVTSGLAGGYCADHAAQIAGVAREAELARLAAGWPPEAHRAFAALREAHEAYADAHAEGEIDLSGTLRVALQIGSAERLRDEFVATLRALEAGDAPRFARQQFRSADASLNAAYRELMRADHGDGPGAVHPEGIRQAQRAWLRYRDAFLAFAALRYPGLPRDSLAAWLTRQRTDLLGNVPAY